MDLSRGALGALKNLSRKRLGEPVGWISIADACALTELGLAKRNRSGWQITDLGEKALVTAERAQATERPDNLLTMENFAEASRKRADQPIFRSPLPQ